MFVYVFFERVWPLKTIFEEVTVSMFLFLDLYGCLVAFVYENSCI